MCINDTIRPCSCQALDDTLDTDDNNRLVDVTVRGKERPWRQYKVANTYLAVAYDDVNPDKARRLRDCCTCLTYDVDAEGHKHLVGMDSCRVRLCPLCSWRRSLKAYHNAMRIIGHISQHYPTIRYIFVTLTCRNCDGEDLSDTIDQLFAGLKRLSERKAVKSVWRGMIRTLEVTHNVDPQSTSYDTYHPHLHLMVAVDESYYKRGYISKPMLRAMWRDCMGLDYDPQVDIRACYDATPHAVAECSKYACKAKDYLIMDDWELTIDTVRILDSALADRRMINYSGLLREVKRKLKLEDVESGSLVHVGDDDDTLLDRGLHREVYWWSVGYQQYYRLT